MPNGKIVVGGTDYKTQKTHPDMKDVQDAQTATVFSTIKGQYTRILVARAKKISTLHRTEQKGNETSVQSITKIDFN
jgi:hypothetical protein